jgi:hypothetical protein
VTESAASGYREANLPGPNEPSAAATSGMDNGVYSAIVAGQPYGASRWLGIGSIL